MKNILSFCLSFACWLLLTTCIHAQNAQSRSAKKIMDTKKEPTLLTFKPEKTYQSQHYQKALATELRLSPKDQFKPLSTQQDDLGFTHQKLQQYYQGLPVENGIYLVHSKNGKVASMNGDFYRIPALTTEPSIDAAQALQQVLTAVNAEKYAWEVEQDAFGHSHELPKGKLLILPLERSDATTFHLAYRFAITCVEPFDSRLVYVDAQSGEVLENHSTLTYCSYQDENEEETYFQKQPNHLKKLLSQQATFESGTADTKYSGTQTIETELFEGRYRLRDYTRAEKGIFTMAFGGRIGTSEDIYDEDNIWSATEYDNAAKDNAALDAHWGVEQTYDYFKTEHDRDSWDNKGGTIYAFVRYDGRPASTVATIGPELVSVLYLPNQSNVPQTGIDIVAHELGHSIAYSHNFFASEKESGSINEGLSDIWGAAVSDYVSLNKNKWVLGSEHSNNYRRNMENPNLTNNPDTYQGNFWVDSEIGGRHNNSTILTHWFYLLSEGSSNTDEINDNGNRFSINGIGIDKAAKIAYRLETLYLTGGSEFIHARNLGIQVAEDIFGVGSPEVIATQNAFYAVGIGEEYQAQCGAIAVTSTKNNIKLNNLVAPIEIIKVYAPNNSLVFECSNNCGTEQTINGLAEGRYRIDIQLFTSNYEGICSTEKLIEVGSTNTFPCENSGGDTDSDGICDNADCAPQNPSLPAPIGSACDDGNPNTSNDQIGADGCTCAGTTDNPTAVDCNALQFATENNQITVSGLAAQSKIEIIGQNTNYQIVGICNGDCTTTQVIPDLMAGDYAVKVQLYGSDGPDSYRGCYREESVTVSEGSTTNTSADCESLQFTVDNRVIHIAGLTATYDKVEIIGKNTNWQVQTICDGNCNDTQIISDLMEGDYAIKVNQRGTDGSHCYREERVTVSNGNPNTGGEANCANLVFEGGDGQITVKGLSASQNTIEMIGKTTGYQIVSICENSCEATQVIPDLSTGIYTVKVYQSGNDGSNCYREAQVAVQNSSQNRNGKELLARDLNIFPNPARQQVVIQAANLEGQTGQIQLYDTFGRLVGDYRDRQFIGGRTIIDLANLENGLYWITIKMEQPRVVGKRLVIESLR